MMPGKQGKAALPLHYAPRRTRTRRRFWLAAALSVIMGVAGTCYLQRDRWVVQVSQRLELPKAQPACLHPALSPDLVVYEEDPDRIASLKGNTDYVIHDQITGKKAALFCAACLEKFDAVARRHPRNTPPEPGGGGKRGTVFLDERTTRRGTHRLVLVECAHKGEGMGPTVLPDYFILTSMVLEPVAYSRTPRWLNADEVPQPIGFGYGNRETSNPQTCARMYAGQPDSADPSHFSIRCRIGSVEWVVDGWLQDSGAGPKVHLAPRQDQAWSVVEQKGIMWDGKCKGDSHQ